MRGTVDYSCVTVTLTHPIKWGDLESNQAGLFYKIEVTVIWYGIAAESDPLGMISGCQPYPPLAIHPHGYQSAEPFRRNDTSH
jgi:hypothetical protein